MLVRALEDEKPWQGIDEDLALAAIGTIGDIVPLTDDNRTLVRYGLKKMESLSLSPLSSLLDLVCAKRPITSTDIAFRIVPRLNAAGRMAHPRLAFDALLQGGETLTTLTTLNEERQDTVKELLLDAEHLFSSVSPLLAHHSEHATPGTVGLIAGRLTEMTGKPSIVSASRDDLCIASLRSPSSVHIADCLGDPRLAPLLISFGGHAQAAGCSFLMSKKEEVHQILTDIIALKVDTETLLPSITAHSTLASQNIPLSFIESLSCLMPFGAGNEEPVFHCPQRRITDLRTVGEDAKHLQCRIDGMKAIGFGFGHLLSVLQKEPTIDVLVTLGINEWNNQKEPQLFIKDLRRSQE
jgi:single-stranded-DNA-specific exonuclease